MADASTIGAAIGVGFAAFGATVLAAWPIVTKVRAAFAAPPAPVTPALPAPPVISMHQSSPQLPAFDPLTAQLIERISGLEERERETVALLHELIGRMSQASKGNGKS